MIIEIVSVACIGTEHYLTLQGDGTAENFKAAPDQIIFFGVRYLKRSFDSCRLVVTYRG